MVDVEGRTASFKLGLQGRKDSHAGSGLAAQLGARSGECACGLLFETEIDIGCLTIANKQRIESGNDEQCGHQASQKATNNGPP